MKKLFKVVAISLLNILVIVALLEGLLRLTAPILPGSAGVATRWVTTGQPFDQTWTPAWTQNSDHFLALRPGLVDALQYGSPSVQFSLSTIELWEGGGIGFRTDPIDFFVDAVVVGDSFGMCFTERADCWVDQLASRTQRRFVNLSQPVTGTTSHYRILRDFGAPLTPPLVVWQFFGNDFNDDYGLAVFRDEIPEIPTETITTNSSPLDWFRKNSALVAVLETLITGRFSAVPEGEQAFVKPYRVVYGENRLQFGGAYELQALNMDNEQNQIGFGYSQTAFEEAKTLVESWGGQLAVVIIPTREEVYAHLTAPIMGETAINQLQSARDAMHDLCSELALLCYDPIDVFQVRAQANEALYYTDDMHLNAYGNAVLATALADWLTEQELLSQNP